MGKKSKAREARRAASYQRFEASKPALIAKVGIDSQPRLLVAPAANEFPRMAPHLARAAAEAEKTPKTIKDGSRFAERMTWCTTKADQEDAWSWGESRAWSQDEWDHLIAPPFQKFAQLTWKEIDQCSSDTGHRMHHGHEVGDLIAEAQARWCELNLEEFDSVFRFRLSGQKRRAWGFIVQAHFHFVWWDREHSIYPTEAS